MSNSNLNNRPPWRAGAPSAEARSRALSRTSTYIDEQGNKITSKMIRERNKSRKGGRRSSTFVAPDIKGFIFIYLSIVDPFKGQAVSRLLNLTGVNTTYQSQKHLQKLRWICIVNSFKLKLLISL